MIAHGLVVVDGVGLVAADFGVVVVGGVVVAEMLLASPAVSTAAT